VGCGHAMNKHDLFLFLVGFCISILLNAAYDARSRK
jgi:hypothetical protein